MNKLGKKKEHNWTNVVLLIVTLAIAIYIAYIKGYIPIGYVRSVSLNESKTLIDLDIKEKSFIGVNSKQIIKVTSDGIIAYGFEGEEIWRDTFSFNDFVVMQKEPYIAVGYIQGKVIQVFNEKGKQVEIANDYPIVYFSINESGYLVTIAQSNNSYIISAYDDMGQNLCTQTSFVSQDGYPLTAEISPDNRYLFISYTSVDEPQVVSSIYCIDVLERDSEVKNNIRYGMEQKNNLVYEIEFINKETWVAIGDKLIVWYDLEGNEVGKVQDLSLVFTPYLTKMSEHGNGYLPMILSEKPTQNIVHRQDELTYYNNLGEKIFSIALNGGAEYSYADHNGVTVQVGNQFKGYNKLGNEFFEYTSNTDVTKVIYLPNIRRGIAVNKESVLLLVPSKEAK